MKRKQGRPRKNQSFKINVSGEKMNFNTENKYPVYSITNCGVDYITKETEPTCISNKNYIVLFYSKYPQTFMMLINLLKSKHSQLIWEFDNTGLSIGYQLPENLKNDIIDIKIKLYANFFDKYLIREKTTIICDIAEIYKIMKTIPKNNKFAMRISKSKSINGVGNVNIEYNPYIMQLVYYKNENNESHNDRYDIITHDLVFKKTLKKVTPKMKYPLIVLSDFKRFKKKCNEMSSMTKIFSMKYINNKLKFTFDSGRCKNIFTYGESEKFVVIKRPKKGYIISNEYNLSSFIKYITKCKDDITDIVKLYISNENPLIIEYDIKNQIGTVQIYVDICNHI